MRPLHDPVRRLRRILVLLPVLALLTAGISVASGDDPGPPAAEPQKEALSTAPDFSGKGVDGKTYRLQELLKNGPVMLDFWTTWCKPCMLELPQLQKLHDVYKKRGFSLLGVVCDDARTVAKIKPTIQSKGFKFPNVVDSDHKISGLYNVRNYPTTILIAQDGKISTVTQGYTPGSEKDLEAKINALLSPRATGTSDLHPARDTR